MDHHIEVVIRDECGSCHRVLAEVRRIAADYNAAVRVHNLTTTADPDYSAEFGDRVPVVLLDDEEHACWEIDEAELRAALAAWG